MKYADSIVKVYSTSMAMLVTMVVSIFLFGISPNMQLGRGTALSKPITTACTGCAFCTLFGHVLIQLFPCPVLGIITASASLQLYYMQPRDLLPGGGVKSSVLPK